MCPRKEFRRDLCQFLTECQNEGESIVLLIDTNENLTFFEYTRKFGCNTVFITVEMLT